MLPQIIRPVLIFAGAARERTLVYQQLLPVLCLLVLRHAAPEPLRRAAGAVAADLAANGGLDFLGRWLGARRGGGKARLWGCQVRVRVRALPRVRRWVGRGCGVLGSARGGGRVGAG